MFFSKTIPRTIMRNYLVGLGLGFSAAAYCIYFDRKRRNAPDYQEKVMARRAEERRKKEQADEIEIPPLHDSAAIEKFFTKEIEIGEELIQAGEVDQAAKHLSYAVAFCPQPQQLLQYLREVLPPTAYKKLCGNLEMANKKVLEAYNKGKSLREEDVE